MTKIFFAGVTATGTSEVAVSDPNKPNYTVFIEASGGSVGLTLKIQALTPTGNWVDLDSRTLSAAGDTVLAFRGAFAQLRAKVSAYTAGTLSVSLNSHRS